jgi:membrane-anchored protein YejM (alkaline phosphatase superfamily)
MRLSTLVRILLYSGLLYTAWRHTHWSVVVLCLLFWFSQEVQSRDINSMRVAQMGLVGLMQLLYNRFKRTPAGRMFPDDDVPPQFVALLQRIQRNRKMDIN